jgi:selenoprotein W-related protein
MPVSPMIKITYCRLCGWGLRAGWMAQELLTTFAEELGSVTLTPIGPVASLRCALMTRSSARGRSEAAFQKSRRSNSSCVAPGHALGYTDSPNQIGWK